MSEDLPIRITSVYTLADDGQKNLSNESQENLKGKTERNDPQSWQNFNEQWATVCSLQGESGSNNFSSKELVKLAAKYEQRTGSVGLPTVTSSDTKSLFSNTISRELDSKTVSSENAVSSEIAAPDHIYTVFRVATDSCPSFCCRYNPVLVTTLRAKARTLNMAKQPKATNRS